MIYEKILRQFKELSKSAHHVKKWLFLLNPGVIKETLLYPTPWWDSNSYCTKSWTSWNISRIEVQTFQNWTYPYFLLSGSKSYVKHLKVFNCPALFKKYHASESCKRTICKYIEQGTRCIILSSWWLSWLTDLCSWC